MQQKQPAPPIAKPETYLRGADVMVEVRPNEFVRADVAARLNLTQTVKHGD